MGHTKSCGDHHFLQRSLMDYNHYGDGMMLFTVRVARRDSDSTEKYRKFVFRAPTWDFAVQAARVELKSGERVVNISEGGYQL